MRDRKTAVETMRDNDAMNIWDAVRPFVFICGAFLTGYALTIGAVHFSAEKQCLAQGHAVTVVDVSLNAYCVKNETTKAIRVTSH